MLFFLGNAEGTMENKSLHQVHWVNSINLQMWLQMIEKRNSQIQIHKLDNIVKYYYIGKLIVLYDAFLAHFAAITLKFEREKDKSSN